MRRGCLRCRTRRRARAESSRARPLIGARSRDCARQGGRLLVHDFMVNDSLDSPALGALWALQHVTVNADGLGLCPAEVGARMTDAGFGNVETQEMIHGLTKLMVAHKA